MSGNNETTTMKLSLFLASLLLTSLADAQTVVRVLRPSWVFDGENMHENWEVAVAGDRILAAGPRGQFPLPADAQALDLPGKTLLPGLIEGHSHLLLHPYNETSWNDQVLLEREGERVARATVHARKTLEAGFTTVRDLGTEGAGYADAGLKAAIEKGVIPGPRMLVAGPAIVATGSYGPKGFADHVQIPVGADMADGVPDLIRLTREQIGKGADLVKVYADYRWGTKGAAMPTFSMEEIKAIVETAASGGRQVVAHAATPEGMRRAVLAGVSTLEHGDGGTEEVFKLMAEKGVALCPTLAAGDAILQYQGWKKGVDPEPDRIKKKKQSFALALKSGVTICAGGDVGVFAHGDNVRELELMVEYGMPPLDVLRSATSVNADVFGLADQVGRIRPGLKADILVVDGRPDEAVHNLRKVVRVMKNGEWVGVKRYD